MKKKSIQNFAVIHRTVEKAKTDNALVNDSQAFHHVVLDAVFQLADDEIQDAITDDAYNVGKGASPGKDRGIDAVYVDEIANPPTVHLLSCKYTSDIQKTESFFKSTEIDKILAFLQQLMSKDLALLSDINDALKAKAKEIWNVIHRTNASFVIHLASNLTEGLTKEEADRLSNALKQYSNFSWETYTQESLADKLAHRGRVKVDGACKAIHQNLFEKPGGDVRALVVHVEARQLLRALCDDEALRKNANADISAVPGLQICEGAFEDNVRIYLRKGSKVNKNIRATVLSKENKRFFYFNNGITITCDRYSYPTGQTAPIIELENIQVVNGGQTVHALFDAYKEDKKSIDPVEILCRVYETKNDELSSRIAETTNSQTPVNTRDIRSIDIVQVKLEKEFHAMGLYYERKRKQHEEQPKEQRVDAERCGQVVLAFMHAMPLEAKNRKGLIFGEKYEDIFSDATSAHELLLPLRLFERIENERVAHAHGQNAWLRYANYHLLYALRLLADYKGIGLTFENLEVIWKNYPKAKAALRSARLTSKKKEKDEYEDALFFKSSDAKILTQATVGVPAAKNIPARQKSKSGS
jgi:hypothetical protein